MQSLDKIFQRISHIPVVTEKWNSWLSAYGSRVIRSDTNREVRVCDLPRYTGLRDIEFENYLLTLHRADNLQLLLVGQLLVWNNVGSAMDAIR